MRTGLRLPICVLLVLAAIASALTISPAVAQQRRFAFVMGNGAYQNIAKLPNALNDANATRSMLQEAGFDVTAATDLSLAGLRSALDVFIDKVKQGGTGSTALVYYAGHAVQLDGANYILPTDIRPETSANIPNQSLSLTEILRKLDSAGARSKIAILDACRNNPFAARELSRGLALQMVDGANEGVRSEAGLARVDSSSGTFVAFATSPGSTAADGTGPNSPFTTALLREAREPGLPIEQVFRRIRLAVYDSTSGIQIPWDTSSLITDVSFFPRAAGTAPAQPAGTPATAGAIPLAARPTAATLRAMAPADAYRTAIAWDRRDIYRSALDINPEDQNALRVHRILGQRTEETAWAETVLAGDAESFKLFVRLYPGSQHENEALRLAASAPSRNRVQVAQTCPICPSVAPQRSRRAEFTPRPVAPGRPSAASPGTFVPASPRPERVVAARPSTAEPIGDPAPAPLLVPAGPGWTGFYVGGHVGGSDQSSRTRLGGFGPTDSVSVSIGAGNVPAVLNPNGRNAVAGGHAGFNFQTGPVVFGLEGDFSAMHTGGRQTVSVNPFGVQVTTRAENELLTLGTVRGRIGVAFGDLLIYGTGGYAFGRTNQAGAINPDPIRNPTYVASNAQMVGGWAAGAGIEYALNGLIGLSAGPRISLRLDYLHYDLGTQNLVLSETTGLAPGEYATMRAKTKGDVLRAGLSIGF